MNSASIEGVHNFKGTDSLSRSVTLSGKDPDSLIDSGIPSDIRVSQRGFKGGAPTDSQQAVLETIRQSLLALDNTPAVRLTADIAQMQVGTPERVLFSAAIRNSAATSTVELFSSVGGVRGSLLVRLFDDGAQIHGDATAGDGVFSNTLAVEFRAPGTMEYIVQTNTGLNDSTEIRGVDAPSIYAMTELLNLADSTEDSVRDLIEGGATVEEAIAVAAAALAGNPAVLPGSVAKTEDSVFWQSLEGITFAVLGNELEFDDERSRGGSASTLADAVPVFAASPITDACGEALVIGAYRWQFNPYDESDEIATMLRNAGYEVTTLFNNAQADENVTLNDLRNLRGYEAVAITTHGDSSSRYGVVMSTGDRNSGVLEAFGNIGDLLTGRVVLANGRYSITPRFITRYASLNDAIVYVGSCRSTYDNSLSNAFIGAGAAAFVGYSDYVGSSFADRRGQSLFQTLLEGNEIGTTPGINVDRESDRDPARFDLRGDATAKLQTDCLLLNDYDLYVEYTWPLDQRDLDTSTHFLSSKVGYGCGSVAPFMSWTGDDTSAGGREKVIVDLNAAFDSGLWSDSVDVSLYAGWYIGNTGGGPATLTVGLRHKVSGRIIEVESQSISPGRQGGCATTRVGLAQVTAIGEGDDTTISFNLA